MTAPRFELREVGGTRSVHLQQGRDVRIGRHKDNDWVLNHASVSRFHALVSWPSEAPRPTIQDLGSANGSQVDHHELPPKEPVVLTRRASVGLGELLFTVSVQSTSSPAILEGSGKLVTLFGAEDSLGGELKDWEAFCALMRSIEDERRTGTLRLSFRRAPETHVVVLGSLLLTRTEGVRLLRKAKGATGAVGYGFSSEVEVGTVDSRGWRFRELLNLLEESEEDSMPTERIRRINPLP